MKKKFILIFIFSFLNLFSNEKLNVAVLLKDSSFRSKIESEISEKKFIQVVERMNMNQILEEMKLGQMGILKEGSYSKAGEILGAEYFFLFGNFSDSFKLISTASGKILGSWSKFSYQNLNDGLKILEREFSIKTILSKEEIKEKDFYFDLFETKNKNSFKLEDEIQFFFKINSKNKKNVYLRILVYSSDHSITEIFPNSYKKENLVSTNEILYFPKNFLSDQMKLIASKPIGEEMFIFIASETDLVNLKSVPKKNELEEDEISVLSKGMTLQERKKTNYILKKWKLDILE